jgi:hypothetical protein
VGRKAVATVGDSMAKFSAITVVWETSGEAVTEMLGARPRANPKTMSVSIIRMALT